MQGRLQRLPALAGARATEVGTILRTPEMPDKFAALGADPVSKIAEEAAEFLKSEIAKSGKIVREATLTEMRR